jgi:hypothetical protein
VNQDVIIINGKRLSPYEFRGFGVWRPGPTAKIREFEIGYFYGGQGFPMPGVWTEQEADEIVLAMNLHFRALFKAPSAHPEQLRNTRPSDF